MRAVKPLIGENLFRSSILCVQGIRTNQGSSRFMDKHLSRSCTMIASEAEVNNICFYYFLYFLNATCIEFNGRTIHNLRFIRIPQCSVAYLGSRGYAWITTSLGRFPSRTWKYHLRLPSPVIEYYGILEMAWYFQSFQLVAINTSRNEQLRLHLPSRSTPSAMSYHYSSNNFPQMPPNYQQQPQQQPQYPSSYNDANPRSFPPAAQRPNQYTSSSLFQNKALKKTMQVIVSVSMVDQRESIA